MSKAASKKELQKSIERRKNAGSKPPAPFEPAPENLLPLLNQLDKSRIYIFHLDKLSKDFKKNMFLLLTLGNIAVVALLIWRLLTVWTFYLDLIFYIIGYQTDAHVEKSDKTYTDLIKITLWRAANLLADYFLIRVVLPWTAGFLFEGPASWRWDVKFSDTEIGIRYSTNWGSKEVLESFENEDHERFLDEKIMPAIDKFVLSAKTTYVLQNLDWGIAFFTMIVATRMVKEGKLSLKDFDKSVFCHSKVHGWMYWPVFKLDDPTAAEEEARKKIVDFKDKLTAMGKESLFFRWVELIQYESSQPGGFTPERQLKSVRQAKELFEKQGVDFDVFLESIGGISSMPGMEQGA